MLGMLVVLIFSLLNQLLKNAEISKTERLKIFIRHRVNLSRCLCVSRQSSFFPNDMIFLTGYSKLLKIIQNHILQLFASFMYVSK